MKHAGSRSIDAWRLNRFSSPSARDVVIKQLDAVQKKGEAEAKIRKMIDDYQARGGKGLQ
jgi:hypothetical protein